MGSPTVNWIFSNHSELNTTNLNKPNLTRLLLAYFWIRFIKNHEISSFFIKTFIWMATFQISSHFLLKLFHYFLTISYSESDPLKFLLKCLVIWIILWLFLTIILHQFLSENCSFLSEIMKFPAFVSKPLSECLLFKSQITFYLVNLHSFFDY